MSYSFKCHLCFFTRLYTFFIIVFALLFVTLQNCGHHVTVNTQNAKTAVIKHSIIITGILFFFISCHDNSNVMLRMDGIEMDSIVAHTSCTLTDEPNSPKCELYVNVQYAKGSHANKINDALMRSGIVIPDYIPLVPEKQDVRNAVDTFVVKFISDYKEFYAPMYKSDKSHPGLYNCRYHLKAESQTNKEGILTYISHVIMYNGGQHEICQTLAKNIRVADGKVVSLPDLFIHGYEKSLKDAVVKNMCEHFRVDDVEGLKSKTIFTDGDIYIPDNFIVGKDKITFIYCEDEIAPHEIGEIRIDVYNDELGKLMR